MKKILWILVLQLATMQVFSQSVMYEITNCGGETRIMLFNNQLSSAEFSSKGRLLFKKNAMLKFSPNSKISLDSLDIAAVSFRKAFPENYWSEGVPVVKLDTKPNEDGRIWIERVYVDENSKGVIKPIAALKVVFEGSSAERERVFPKIKDITITSNPKELKKYIAVIKRLKIANNVKLSDIIKVNDDAPPPPIRSL